MILNVVFPLLPGLHFICLKACYYVWSTVKREFNYTMKVAKGKNKDWLEKWVNNWQVFFSATGWFSTHCFEESDREAICS